MDRLKPGERSSGQLPSKRATWKRGINDLHLGIVHRKAENEEENGGTGENHVGGTSNHYPPSAPPIFLVRYTCALCKKRLLHLPVPPDLSSSVASNLDTSSEKGASRASCSPSRNCMFFSRDYTIPSSQNRYGKRYERRGCFLEIAKRLFKTRDVVGDYEGERE